MTTTSIRAPSAAYTKPPTSSTNTVGTVFMKPATGNSTFRSRKVRNRFRYDRAMVSSAAATIRSRSPYVSIVRLPSPTAAEISATSPLAALSARYASRARTRYQCRTHTTNGIPASATSPSTGSSQNVATNTTARCTTPVSTSGTLSRNACPTVPTSVVTRVSRSPMLSRSTTRAGNARDRATASSRNEASSRSPRRAACKAPYRNNTRWATAAPSTPSAIMSTVDRVSVPSSTPPTILPSR